MKEEEKNGFKEAKKNLKSLLMIVIIVIICVCIFSASLWFLKRIRTKEDTNNPKNAPGVVRNFMNDTNIDVNGKISSSKSIRQLWEEMRNNGNDILQYLDSAEELAKLIQAAQALDFPDTRENPDEPIDWKNIDLDSTEIQGIVKFKRALEDGNEITMSYVTPSKLQELMNKYMDTGKEEDKQEALKHFTIEKTYSASGGTTIGGNPLVQELLTYACSWVGKIPYKSIASGDGDNNERFLPLKAGRASDCSHFVHWVFEHVGLMHKDKFVHSLDWGKGGDNGGCPGTVRIGTDLSNASPGDVLWWHYGGGWNNHVAIYLGNNKTVECCAGKGVIIGSVKKLGANCQILHFKDSIPTDPTGYFDPDTMTLHSSLVNSGSGNIAKVSSLRGMVFLGDSILDSIVNHCSILKNEGAITKYQSGCRPRFFLGEETVRGRRFNWDKEFGTITNPTGFYLLLGQNSCHDKNNRIKEMDKLIQKIKSRYPSAPIYMSSVLYHIDRDGSDKRAATAMNEELKVYCAGQTNVYYSDILRGYNDNLGVMSYDNDHPNKKGSELLINNIKENIIGYSGATTSPAPSTSSTSSSAVTYVNTNIPDSAEYDATNCFSADTQQIINAHRNDFNVNNFKQKMKEAGGYENYVRSLGGVFAKYIDKKDIQVKTAGEFQEIAEYVFGLMTIWGFDYGNGTTHLSWGAKATKDLRASAFYPNGTNSSCFLPKNVNDICGRIDNPKMKINCNYGVEMLLRTAGLVKNGELYGEDDKDGNTLKKAKKLIDNKSELQVGDIMYFYRDEARTDWHHSAIVGEVDKQKNVIVLYEFAGRFIEHAGRYKIKVKIDDTKDFGNGYRKNWRGARYFDIDQTTVAANTETSTSGYTSQYQVKVATWNEHQEKVESNDPEIESSDTGLIHDMTTTMIPYQPIVSKFKMPFNYLYIMLVYGQEKEFAFDLTDLVKNSKIEITIHDNVSRTKNVSTDTYTDVTLIKAHADSATVRCMKNPTVLDPTIAGNNSIFENTDVSNLNASDTIPKNRKVVYTSIYNTNYLDIALTLADAWYTRYEKRYTYNEPTENDSTTTNIIGDTVIDEHTENNTLGGLDGKIDDVAKDKARKKIPDTVSARVLNKNNKHADFKTTRMNRINTLYMYTRSSSYIPVPSKNSGTGGVYTSKYGPVSSIGETPKTGQLNKNNFIPLPYKKQPNVQEGFCLVGDNLFAVSMMSNSGGRERSRIYLIDMATFSVCDTSTYLNGHGNSLTYDTVTGDIIYPDKSGTTLIHVNPATKKFENTRKVKTPANDQIAYNKHYDLFITYNCVYTREQFYSNGKPQKAINHKSPHRGLVIQAQGTYGNQVYFCYSAGNGNYILVCNIHTGKQEKVLYDNTRLEIEEVDFTNDGTMYSIYNGTKESLYKTDYNYFADNDIDKSNVTPLASNSNSIAMYNTGGDYIDKSSFESIFNSHFNAKTNILSITDWLFGALEQNSDTKRMVDLTKYLLYRATGNDYGVTTFDFEAYQLEDFNEIGAGTLEGNNTEERVWLALIGAGFNDVAAAAAMGNLSYESGGSDTKTIKTDTVEGGYTEDNGGIGMCQWTNNGRGTEGRNAQLKKYAQSKGTTWKDEKTQIEFLITEITGEGSAKGYANIQFMTKTYDGVTYPKDAMKTVENNQSRIEYATKAFAATFERPAASAFTSSMSKRVELAKHFYSLYNGKRSSLTGNGDILRACEEVIQICLSRNVEYSVDQNKLIYYNIEKCLNEAKYGCCATFTSLALYKSGLLTADQMNKYNCHFTGEGGVPDMLKAAGWRQVQMSEAKAGDVVNDYGNHVLIYAGGDNFYDNRCGIHGKDNEYAATGKIRSGFNNSYRNRSGIQVWRAPGK